MSATSTRPVLAPRRAPQRRWPMDRETWVAVARALGALAIAAWALSTPGFLSRLSLFAMLTSVSFAGCVAVGMAFITMSGNIMSLALGATVSAASLVFMASTSAGPSVAALAAIGFAALLTAAQGAVIGYFRSNAILVSIAALACIMGFADVLTGGQRVMPSSEAYAVFRSKPMGVPFELLAFLATAAVGQIILSMTRIGREIKMTGSNRRAAETAGLNTPASVIWAYGIAGACCGIAGVLLASRYGSGDMDVGSGFEYRAIAAVLVGGNAIQGGSGSAWRACAGVLVIATIEMVLRLRGYSEQLQYLITGLVVLAVVMLQWRSLRR